MPDYNGLSKYLARKGKVNMSMQDSQYTSGTENTNYSGSSNTIGSSRSSEIYDTGVKAQQKTGELIDQAQEKVGEVADKVKEQASSQATTQKDRAAEGLGSVADAIRQTGDQLRQNDKVAPVAQYTDQLAMGIESVSNFIKNRSVSDIVREVENFARREPALFLGGALTLGLLGGRFLRSSGSSYSNSNQYQSNTALARPMDTSSYQNYGSRSTGYSTSLTSDVVPGYSAYDLTGRGSTEDANDIYSDSTTGNYSGTSGAGSSGYNTGSGSGLSGLSGTGSTGATGSGSYSATGADSGYNSSSTGYDTTSGTSYGSSKSNRGRSSGTGSGGSLGGV